MRAPGRHTRKNNRRGSAIPPARMLPRGRLHRFGPGAAACGSRHAEPPRAGSSRSRPSLTSVAGQGRLRRHAAAVHVAFGKLPGPEFVLRGRQVVGSRSRRSAAGTYSSRSSIRSVATCARSRQACSTTSWLACQPPDARRSSRSASTSARTLARLQDVGKFELVRQGRWGVLRSWLPCGGTARLALGDDKRIAGARIN